MENKHTSTVSHFPSLSRVYEQAWKLYKQKLWIILGVNVFPVTFGLLYILLLKTPFAKNESFESGLLLFVIAIVSAVLNVVSQAALVYAIAGKHTVLQAYQKGWAIVVSFFWVDFLVILRIFVGLLLLIIPGIYMFVQYLFTEFILVVEGKKGMNALSASAAYVKAG
jgi:hypothetical protein